MLENTYFRLNKSTTVVTIYDYDDQNSFQIDSGSIGYIVDYRIAATFLNGWIKIAVNPHNEFLVENKLLQSSSISLTRDEYLDTIRASQILQTTWLDKTACQFELVKSLKVNQWVIDEQDNSSNLVSTTLPVGTVGKIKSLSWDFEGSDDKQYWMMEIETIDGKRFDVMYPELLVAAKPYISNE